MAWIESKFIWDNWKFIPWEQSQIHTVNHALHYGTSVFEWIRFYQTPKWPKIFRLKDHIKRLFFSASVLDMEIPYSVEDIVDVCIQLVKKNWLENWYIRPIVFYWYWKMGLDPIWADLDFVISAWPWWKYLSSDPIKVWVSKFRRLHPQTAVMEAKLWWYYITSALSHRDASKRGFDEALLLDTEWFVAEWPGENIFFIQWNNIITPAGWTILPGITRDSIMKFVQDDLKYNVIQTDIALEDISNFDEAFFSWTAAEITPIWSITDLDWNKVDYVSKKSLEIWKYYMDIVNGKNPKYENWLY